MIPSLMNNKKMVSAVLSRRGDRDVETAIEVEAPSGDGESMAMKQAAEDVLSAFENKSILDMAAALRAAFQICESEPHYGGEHIQGDEDET